MKPISQPQPPLIGGVSREAPEYRDRNTVEECINFLPDATLGLIRRPPSDHIARLVGVSVPAPNEKPLVHPVNRDGIEEYRVIISGGTLKVFDNDTGAERTVIMAPGSSAYLGGIDGFRAVTAADTTWITNRAVTVRKGTKAAPSRNPEAIVFFRQTDYSTDYTVTIDGIPVTYRTPGGTSQGLSGIKTDVAAQELFLRLLGTLGSTFDFRRIGSSIYIRRKDNKDFRIVVDDGLADRGLRVVKGSVQRAEDLPFRAVHGMVVEVAGDPGTNRDNWFAVFFANNGDAGDGLWREGPRPGTRVALDPTTMPHVLRRNGPTIDGLNTLAIPSVSYAPTADAVNFPATRFSPVFNIGGQIIYRRIAIPLGTLTNAPRELRFTVDIDALNLPSGGEVLLEVNTSAAPNEATTIPLRFRGTTSQYLTVASGQNANEEITVDLRNVGARPLPLGAMLYILISTTVSVSGTSGDAITASIGSAPITVERDTDIVFQAADAYPPGYVLEVRDAGTNALIASYTAATSLTGTSLAPAFAAAVNGVGGLSATVPQPGRVALLSTQRAVSVTGVPPANIIRLANVPSGTPPSELIGRNIVNLTTGASGTATAYTEPYLTVALSGGSRSTILSGDEIAVFGTGNYFHFGPVRWTERGAGDDVTCPWPSFVDRKITDVFVWQNRLGAVCEDRVLLTESDNYANWFRTSAVTLLESDPVDIQSSLPELAWFHSAVPYQGRLYLASDRGLFTLDGDPAITPGTARLSFVTAQPSFRDCAPVVAGDLLLFAAATSRTTRLNAMRVRDANLPPLAENLTSRVPKYLDGSPLVLAAAPTQRRAFVVTDKRDAIYVFSWAEGAGGALAQAAWVQWKHPGTIISIDTLGNDLGIVTQHADGLYLSRIELDREPFA